MAVVAVPSLHDADCALLGIPENTESTETNNGVISADIQTSSHSMTWKHRETVSMEMVSSHFQRQRVPPFEES